jgi:mono/diheme cytochrome c family protein
MTRNTLNPMSLSLLALLAGASLCTIPGCRGDRFEKPPRQFFPDMDDSPKWKPQTKTELFADGRAMRQPVAGTVAFGASADPADAKRAGYLREDAAFNTGKGKDGKPLTRMPSSVTVDMKLIERGQERFNIYCSVCHGYQGQGDGLVGAQYAVVPANLTSENYTDTTKDTGTDGHLFDVIRNGLWDNAGGMRMPAYGHAINPSDAWAIVAYIRTLQAVRSGTRADVPEAMLQQLDAKRPPAPAATPAATPSTTPAPTSAPAGGSKGGK